jgi:tetratricopeptide (TPR) repeat protein
MLNKLEEAINDSNTSTSIDPSFVRVFLSEFFVCLNLQMLIKGYTRAGKCYLMLGKFNEARRQYQEALQRDPKNETALQELQLVTRAQKEVEAGNSDLESKDWHKALAHFEIAIKHYSPNSDSLKLRRIKALLGLKKFQEVVSATRFSLHRVSLKLKTMQRHGASGCK